MKISKELLLLTLIIQIQLDIMLEHLLMIYLLKLQKILKLLPALKKPTISSLTVGGWVACEVIIEESQVRKLVPLLKEAGAQGIIEYPLNKVIP